MWHKRCAFLFTFDQCRIAICKAYFQLINRICWLNFLLSCVLLLVLWTFIHESCFICLNMRQSCHSFTKPFYPHWENSTPWYSNKKSLWGCQGYKRHNSQLAVQLTILPDFWSKTSTVNVEHSDVYNKSIM